MATLRQEIDWLKQALDHHEKREGRARIGYRNPLDRAEARIAELGVENAKLKTQNKSLQTRMRNLEEKLSYLTQRHNKQIAEANKKADGITGGMPKELLNKLRKCAHSDRTPSPEERHEAMIGLNAWVEDFERAAARSGPLPGFWGK
jgi:chromosome segregation ATPase